MPNISSTLWRGPRSHFETFGEKGSIAVDLFRCQHCGRQVFCCDPVTKRPKRAEDCGGVCNNCGQNICPACVNLGTCTPLEEAMRRQEERYHRRKEYGLD
jgi:hypothetical protein